MRCITCRRKVLHSSFFILHELMESLLSLLTDWGYVGLFLSALLAGSIIPFSSELVMAALVAMGL